MKKGFLFLLLSIFALFIVEHRHSIAFPQQVNFQKNSPSASFLKKHHTNQSITGFSTDFSDGVPLIEAEEDGLDFNPNPFLVFENLTPFATYLLQLWPVKRVFPSSKLDFVTESVKKYILIRSLRI